MIVVTGATGKFGSIVIEDLLARGVPAGEIVAAVRSPEKAAGFAERGVQVRRADYTEPESLVAAFAGADKVLFVSGSEPGHRADGHRNVVAAARTAGVGQIVYTSLLNLETGQLTLADDHKMTEALILESGIPFVFLRNGFYFDLYSDNIGPALEHGALVDASSDGRLSLSTRVEFANAAAAVLATEGHDNKVYELGGDHSFSLPELAEEVSRQTGRTIAYRNLTPGEYTEMLVGFGLPRPLAEIYADTRVGTERGDLFTTSDDLSRLLGRPTTTLADAVAAKLKELG
ncbi:SDR family oxidoreductase [Micromonospora sp. NPDC050397]|uniref:SDR family oxidoreductase n=1 Tax=Micromonospora sp. NPDC050397 TaxID=3364279 RepID=UPI00384C22D4